MAVTIASGDTLRKILLALEFILEQDIEESDRVEEGIDKAEEKK